MQCSRPVLLPAGDSRDRDVRSTDADRATGTSAPVPVHVPKRQPQLSKRATSPLAIISTDESGALSSPTVQFAVDASAATQYVEIIPGDEIYLRRGREELFFNHLLPTVSCFLNTTHTTQSPVSHGQFALQNKLPLVPRLVWLVVDICLYGSLDLPK